MMKISDVFALGTIQDACYLYSGYKMYRPMIQLNDKIEHALHKEGNISVSFNAHELYLAKEAVKYAENHSQKYLHDNKLNTSGDGKKTARSQLKIASKALNGDLESDFNKKK